MNSDSVQPPMDRRTQQLLTDVTDVLSIEHGEELIGVYPFGSIAWGDYVPESSDIDLLAVVERGGASEERARTLAEGLTSLARAATPLAGLEMYTISRAQAEVPTPTPIVELEFGAYRDGGLPPQGEVDRSEGSGRRGSSTPKECDRLPSGALDGGHPRDRLRRRGL